MVHINDLPLLGDTQVALGILSSCWPSYFIWTLFPSYFFLSLLTCFDRRIMQVCGHIMGPCLWESFQGPLVRHHVQLPISFRGISFLFMEDCAPSIFIGNWCRNPSFGLETKARVCKRVRAEIEAWESHFMFPRKQESVREWTPTSQVNSHFGS